MPIRPPRPSPAAPVRADRLARVPSRRAPPVRRLDRGNRWAGVARRTMLVAVIGYVSFHVLQGEFSFGSLAEQNNRTAEAEERIAELQQRHDRLEERVARLSGNSLDLDLLEERVRAVLGWARPDEYVFVVKSGQAVD